MGPEELVGTLVALPADRSTHLPSLIDRCLHAVGVNSSGGSDVRHNSGGGNSRRCLALQARHTAGGASTRPAVGSKLISSRDIYEAACLEVDARVSTALGALVLKLVPGCIGYGCVLCWGEVGLPPRAAGLEGDGSNGGEGVGAWGQNTYTSNRFVHTGCQEVGRLARPIKA
jgi:hypothetical protein